MEYRDFVKAYRDACKDIYLKLFVDNFNHTILNSKGFLKIGVCRYVNKKHKFKVPDLGISKRSDLRYRDYLKKYTLMLHFKDSHFKLMNSDGSICIDVVDVDTVYSVIISRNIKRSSSGFSCSVYDIYDTLDFKKVFRKVIGYNFDKYIEKTLYLFYNILISVDDMTVDEIHNLYKEYMFIIYGNDFWNVCRLYEKRYTKLIGDYLVNIIKKKIVEYSINNGINNGTDYRNDCGNDYGIDYNIGEIV